MFPFLIVFMGDTTPKIFLSMSIWGFHMRILRIYACYLEHWVASEILPDRQYLSIVDNTV